MKEVVLRPIALSDTNDIIKWRNSDAVRLNMCDQRFITAEQHRNFFHDFIETKRIIQYIIEAGKKPIGTVFLKLINKSQSEIGIFIGEDNYRGKGYGTRALELFFLSLCENDQHMLYLKVLKNNLPALRLYKKFGFEQFSDEEKIVKMIKVF